MHERVADRGGRTVWIGRGGGTSAMAIPSADIPKGNEVSETIDRTCMDEVRNGDAQRRAGVTSWLVKQSTMC